MNNLKFVLICLIVFFAGLMHAKERNIVVTAVGSGTTRNAALHDAMRKAIVKAVGAYVSTKSTLKNSDFKEEIIVNSDATVTKYNEIEAVERHGMWQIKIIAEVLPNEFLKYCPKHLSDEVSSAEIGNLLNKEKMFQNVEKTMAEIFKDYYLYIYNFKKVGNIRLASDSDLSGDNVKIEVDYKASINQKFFSKLQWKLCSLLDKVSVEKGQWHVDKSAARHISRLGKQLWTQACSKTPLNAKDYKIIGFQQFTESKIICKVYLVPKKVFDSMLKAMDHKYRAGHAFWRENAYSYLVQILRFRGGIQSKSYYYFLPGLRFYYVIPNLPVQGLTIVNILRAEAIDDRYYKSLRVTRPKIKVECDWFPFYHSLTITAKATTSKDSLSNMQKCYLFFTGIINANDGPAYIERNHGLLQQLEQQSALIEEKIPNMKF